MRSVLSLCYNEVTTCSIVLFVWCVLVALLSWAGKNHKHDAPQQNWWGSTRGEKSSRFYTGIHGVYSIKVFCLEHNYPPLCFSGKSTPRPNKQLEDLKWTPPKTKWGLDQQTKRSMYKYFCKFTNVNNLRGSHVHWGNNLDFSLFLSVLY